MNKLNLYFCITKNEYEDNTGATLFPCELVAAASTNKARYLAHQHHKGALDYYSQYIDWKAQLIEENVEYQAGVLKATDEAWDKYDTDDDDDDFQTPRCCFCGRFVKMSEASLYMKYDIGGTYEPPDPEWICKKCAKEKGDNNV